MVRLLVLLALASVELVRATAVGVKRQDNEDIITLNSAQIDTFTPFTRFASAAYCNPSLIRNWNCGGAFAHSPHPLSICLDVVLLERRSHR